MARKSSFTFTESKYSPDLVTIMAAGEGPYTRSMLATELGKLHPSLYWQDLMNEVSAAILKDRLTGANRFKVVRRGWYELTTDK